MSDEEQSNVHEITYSKCGNGSYYHTFGKDPPKEKKEEPLYAVRLGQEFLKTAFTKYLFEEEYRKEIFLAAKDTDDMSLLTVNEDFENIVNMVLVKTLLKSFFVSEHLVMQNELLKHALLEVYNELYQNKNGKEMNDFVIEEMKKFGDAQRKKESLKKNIRIEAEYGSSSD